MKYLLFTILLGAEANLFGQSQKFDTAKAINNLSASADKMRQSLANSDYWTFTSYVHPQIIKMAGGKDKLIEATKESFKQMEDQGYKISGVTVDTPKNIINSQNRLQAIVKENLTIKTTNGHFVGKSYLIAVSSDIGKTWYFIDTSNKALDSLKSMFPFLSNKLIIPPREQPTFYQN